MTEKWLNILLKILQCKHSHKKRKDSLETRAEPADFLYNLSSKNY